MKRILCGFIMNGKAGGVDRFMLNLRESLVSVPDVRVDFLTNDLDEELQEQLSCMGSSLYEVPSLSHPIKQYRAIRKILSNNNYDIVFLNFSAAINIFAPKAARKSNVPRIIIHSHNSANDISNPLKRAVFGLLHKLGKRLLHQYATDCFACSYKAGQWLFPSKILKSDKFQIIPNTVDTGIYQFSLEKRNSIRKDLGIESKYVIGHIGNFLHQKNHEFLISLFGELHKKEPNALLMCIGDGPNMEHIVQLVHRMDLQDSVLFLGRQNSADGFYNAMDVFVLPSLFEGMPIVAVEAQVNQLPCLLSNRISNEASLSDGCQFLSIGKTDAWVESILSLRNNPRTALKMTVDETKYDLEKQTSFLNNLVLS